MTYATGGYVLQATAQTELLNRLGEFGGRSTSFSGIAWPKEDEGHWYGLPTPNTTRNCAGAKIWSRPLLKVEIISWRTCAEATN